jgi:hypothetical protein
MSGLRVATILPIPMMHLAKRDDYHMCLAHLVESSHTYREFFRVQAGRGAFVLMDNGVVETGESLPFTRLLSLARGIRATQMTLPDRIYDSAATLRMHKDAVETSRSTDRGWCEASYMAIPQGRTLNEWVDCATRMVDRADDWGLRAIGITKFLEGMIRRRSDAILRVPGLIESDLDIHLLGTLGDDPSEIYWTSAEVPDRIRGVDSGAAAIWTQAGMLLGDCDRPDIGMDFEPKQIDVDLLRKNLCRWACYARYGRAVCQQ